MQQPHLRCGQLTYLIIELTRGDAEPRRALIITARTSLCETQVGVMGLYTPICELRQALELS